LETHGVPFFISALETYGGTFIRDRTVQFSSWAVQFKTAHPGLYLLIHLIPSFALVSNGLVEYLAKLGLGLWLGDESEGDSASTPGEGQYSGNEMSGSDDEQFLLAASNQTDGYGTGETE
jgi:hypothetical protein